MNPTNRRDFLKGILRWTTAGGLVGLGLVLFQRSRYDEQEGYCKRCSKLKDCNLPEGVKTRWQAGK